MKAKEFAEKIQYELEYYDEGGYQGVEIESLSEKLIEFAEYHVREALKAACSKSRIIDDPDSYTGNTGNEYLPDQIIDKESILDAYPLENIH